MHGSGTFGHRRTTINIDEVLLQRASELTGTKEKTALVRAGRTDGAERSGSAGHLCATGMRS